MPVEKVVTVRDLEVAAAECDAMIEFQNYEGPKAMLKALATIARYVATIPTKYDPKQ